MVVHTGRELGIVAQVETQAAYLALREDLTRGAYAAYAAELLDRLTEDAEMHTAREFRLLDDTLARLDTHHDVRLVVRYFEMHLLDLLGFKPELKRCAVGRDEITARDQFFSFPDGGVICPEHIGARATRQGVVPVPVQTLTLLRHVQRSTWPQVAQVVIAPNLHDDLERVMLGYITHTLERRLQSIEFIRRLRRDETRQAQTERPVSPPPPDANPIQS